MTIECNADDDLVFIQVLSKLNIQMLKKVPDETKSHCNLSISPILEIGTCF